MQITETTYTYQELSDEAKEVVKRWWYEHGVDPDWYDYVYENFKNEGYELGFDVGRMNFSGFYSQGDGACWSGQIDIVAWLRSHCEDSIARDAWCALIQDDFTGKHMPIGYNSNHYSHSGTMSISHWEGAMFDYNLEGDEATLREQSIFKGMNCYDVFKIITSSDFPYKSVADLAEAIEQSARDYADELYKQLREEYEHIISEENLIEMCEINDWKFDEEGKMQ